MLARWLPKMSTDEAIAHGPGAVNSAMKPPAVSPELLVYTGTSGSSSSSSGLGQGINTVSSDDSRSISGCTSPAPGTVVYGFDIPVRKPVATSQAGGRAAAATEEEQVTAVPQAMPVVSAKAVCDAAEHSSSKEQQRQAAVSLDKIATKLAAAAAADCRAAAAGSWQLAAGVVGVTEELDDCLSSSSSSGAVLTAVGHHVSSYGHGLAGVESTATAGAHAAKAPAPGCLRH